MVKLFNRIKHILKSITKLNVRQKLIFSYILIVAIPISILQINAFQNVKDMTEKEYINNIAFEVEKLKSDIVKNVEQYVKATQFILNNQDFIDFVSIYQERSPEEIFSFKVNVLDEIEYLQYVNFNINRIRFFTNNVFLPETWPVLYQLDRIKNQKYIADFLDNPEKISLWKINNTDNLGPPLNNDTKVVSYYTKVIDSVGNLVGIIEVNMLTDEFFANELTRSNRNSVMVAITKDGEIVYNHQLSDFLRTLKIDLKDFKEFLIKKTDVTKNEEIVYFRLGRTSAAFVYTYVPMLGMYLYKVVLFDALTQKINQLTIKMLWQVVVLMFISSALIFVIISLILRKLKDIISTMRKVENGDFDVKIEIKGDDEIDELAFHFQKMIERIKVLIVDTVKKELAQKDAQIKALQSQINAHFIYNVLENIKMMAECKEDYEVSDAITKLGKMMRYNMSWKRKFVTLYDELENIKNYVALMNLRFDKEIKLMINIYNEEILNYEVPKLILQPIIENSITYGIEPKGEGGSIFIDANVIGEFLVITIVDDGKGIEEEKLRQIQEAIEKGIDAECYHGQGIALKNVNERIKLTYGKAYGLKIESKENEFTKVTITLPFENRVDN
ncbi:integral membrane sensor signal transduction histidine kinase [Caldicellulosiruptor saccharolyticus DSM 8903]|uniref:histidine kinase n=1 Tax=Caldicellulosiruptor saccharolyticus (strain ATCC 43494 / DSM 8903 / Tp8T 6331) TaxID=351627 RepID=A4XMI9_CALS8|nr:sensor histidine kinase [Caldicellulosiruptor saccharolyticus]ABP68124.1 integral membrane sensor signal transduction histidine kinase [Caldicellulosiruptor saccharolyticus DSM 8903]